MVNFAVHKSGLKNEILIAKGEISVKKNKNWLSKSIYFISYILCLTSRFVFYFAFISYMLFYLIPLFSNS